MGLRGPAPKPTDLRILEGNPSRRSLPAREPRFEVGLPERPKKASPAARKVWDELVEEMAGAAVLRRVDRRALWQLAEDEALLEAAYAGLWQMIVAAGRDAKQEGKELSGGPVIALLSTTRGRLAMAALRDLGARVIIERREFGLTPSSRSRVETVAEATAVDSLEQKLCG